MFLCVNEMQIFFFYKSDNRSLNYFPVITKCALSTLPLCSLLFLVRHGVVQEVFQSARVLHPFNQTNSAKTVKIILLFTFLHSFPSQEHYIVQ